MADIKSVADAKKNLSELMSRAAYNNDRFLIQRGSKPMAVLVSIEDLARLENDSTPPKGLLSAVGAWADFDNLDEVIEEIYLQLDQAQDSPVDLDE